MYIFTEQHYTIPTRIDDWCILISEESDGDWTMQFTVNSVARSDGCIYLNIYILNYELNYTFPPMLTIKHVYH